VARIRSKTLIAIAAPAVYAFACGGGSTSHVDSGIHLLDMGSGGNPDGSGSGSNPGGCSALTSYSPPAFGSNNSQAQDTAAGGSNVHEQDFFGVMNSDVDVLGLSLFANFGGFGSGGDIAPGTYTIQGDDAAWSTCVICVLIATDVGSDGTPKDFYFATSGSVTLTTVTGQLSGSVTGANFIHVGTSMGQPADPPAVDSCASTISSATFNTPLTAAFTSPAVPPIVLHHRYR